MVFLQLMDENITFLHSVWQMLLYHLVW